MKRFLTPILVVAVALISSLMLAEDKKTEVVTVTGFVTDSGCGPAGAQAGHDPAKCVKEKGAKWAIYDEAHKTVYVISNAEMGPKMMETKAAGKKLTAKGSVDEKTHMMRVTEYHWD